MDKISQFLCQNTNHTFEAYPDKEGGNAKVNSTTYQLECKVFDDLNGNLIIHNHFLSGQDLHPNRTENMKYESEDRKWNQTNIVPLVFNRTDIDGKKFKLGWSHNLELLDVSKITLNHKEENGSI